ncbi:MAG: hypothetical protein Q7S21_04700 [archaeon]|nr:hypothetical protein [archaeon]
MTREEIHWANKPNGHTITQYHLFSWRGYAGFQKVTKRYSRSRVRGDIIVRTESAWTKDLPELRRHDSYIIHDDRVKELKYGTNKSAKSIRYKSDGSLI